MRWFVIRADKLISSVQVGSAGSLHDYVTLLQVHNIFPDLHDAGSYHMSSIWKEKKKNMTRRLEREMFIAMHIR